MIGVFRHAKAVMTDDEMARPLSEKGIADARGMAICIDIKWDQLVCSPAVRAEQTGLLFTESLMPLILEVLYANSDPLPRDIDNILTQLEPYLVTGKNLLIVTHQPLVCPLLSALAILQGLSGQSILHESISAGEGAVIDAEKGNILWFRH